jgi:hypothetical protein
MNLAPDVAGLSSDTRFVTNFGAGLKLFFTPEIALRFDWRGHAVDVGDSDWDGGCDDWDGCCDDWDCDYWDDWDDDWLGFSEVSLGMTFVF